MCFNSKGESVFTYRELHCQTDFKQGDPSLPIFEMDGFTIGLGIGDDLLSPSYWQALSLRKPDILCHVSRCDKEAPNSWQSLVEARAIDCQTFFVSCGNIRKCVNFNGSPVTQIAEGNLVICDLDFRAQSDYRAKNTVPDRPDVYSL